MQYNKYDIFSNYKVDLVFLNNKNRYIQIADIRKQVLVIMPFLYDCKN